MPTILDLLMALNQGDLPPLPDPAKPVPIPYAPVPNLGPLSNDTTAAFAAQNPEPVPPRLIQPAAPDMDFVSQQTGAPPTAPAPLSRAQRIFNALAGFGAGYQGNGAQFLAQLQEPQREYQRQLERYQGRRTQAIEASERRAEREAEQANRAAELQYNRDFQIWLKKNGVREGEAAKQAEYAFELLKEARKTAETERKEKVLMRRQIALQIDDRIKAYRDQGAGDHSEELARSDFRMALEQLGEKVPPLSAAAAKANTLVQAKIQRALRLAQGGGGTGGGVDRQTAKLVQEFNTARETLIRATASGQTKTQDQTRKRIDQLVRRLVGRPGVEAGYGAGQWPYLKVNGVLQGAEETGPSPQPPLAQAKTITRAEMQTLGLTEADVKAEGYTITP